MVFLGGTTSSVPTCFDNYADSQAGTAGWSFREAQVENYHCAVDELVDSGVLQRLLALTDISFSNSLIESWWRALKHQWLFLNSLDTIGRLENLVAFYVDEHNTRLPHSAFRGQTPDEMYFGTGAHIPDELDSAKKLARQSRMEVNRATSCPTCQPLVALAS